MHGKKSHMDIQEGRYGGSSAEGRAMAVVSNGAFPDLFQDIFHPKVRLVRTRGVHFKDNHRPHLFPECCPVLNITWKAVAIQQRRSGPCPSCVGIDVFSLAFQTSFSFFDQKISYFKWIGSPSYPRSHPWPASN